jgi:hypothetical protein
MARARSPEYPAISLKEAIDRVKMIYDRDYQNRLPRAVVATHMGYKGLSGASLPILSSLLKYGLMEGRGDETRVSDLAVALLAHAPGTPERTQALYTASSLPELFAELDAKFQGGKASDQALRSYLLTNKFIPGAADAAIRAYRDTKQLVDAESVGYIPPEPTENTGVSNLSEETRRILNKSLDSVKPPIQEVFHLPEGTVTISFPTRLSMESYQDLEDQLSLILRRVKRQAGKDEEAAH